MAIFSLTALPLILHFITATTASPSFVSNNSIVDIDWKFNHILVLPVGCPWARDLTWRVRMRCPIGHFFVPTRLQASTNQSFYCFNGNISSSLFENEEIAHQKFNEFRHLEKSRQLAARIYGDGHLNRYDYPYPPIYGRANSYWNCVGTGNNEKGCSFLVRARDYANRPASHNALLAQEPPIATLILPGPYCSTVDSFEYIDRSGGTVYRTSYSSHNSSSRIDRLFFKNQSLEPQQPAPTIVATETGAPLEPSNKNENNNAPPNNINRFNIYQSENIYLAARGDSKTGRRRFSRCVATLVPRDVNLARSLWNRKRFDFVKSLLANIHVTFIELVHGDNYSAFYDDMTALQHGASLRNQFVVDEFDNTTGAITLSINFNVERSRGRASAGHHQQSSTQSFLPLRIGLALYEFLVVGDENAALLQSMWPYRYMTPFSQRILVLLRNATIDECQLEPGLEITDNGDDNSAEEEIGEQLLKIDTHGLTLRPPEPQASAQTCYWCIWSFWLVMAAIIILMIAASIGILYLCTR